jgi:hypothetical protein
MPVDRNTPVAVKTLGGQIWDPDLPESGIGRYKVKHLARAFDYMWSTERSKKEGEPEKVITHYRVIK